MLRLLYADDDPQIAEIVRLFFRTQMPACQLTHVPDGRACLDRLARERFDFVLLDLTMPGLNGLQVLGELAARRDPTPVLMVSAQGNDELAVQALRAGAVDCINKNSQDFTRLPDIVRRLWEKHAPAPKTRASSAAPRPALRHVAYVDSSAAERALLEKYFAAHAPSLQLAAFAPTEFETLSDRWEDFGAVVLGPELGAARLPELLRRLHSHAGDVPVVVITAAADGEAAIAAFKLGAQDVLVRTGRHLVELIFSLNHLMKRRETERQNARLVRELAELNASLEGQVQKRTQQLQAVSQRLIHVQEAERRVIAQELHDQIGQMLTGLRFQLDAARLTGAPVAEALTLTDELLRQVRDLALQLRPRILDDFGLQRALEWHVERFHRQTGIAVACDITLPESRFAHELETTAFRLVQEALTNIARHAGSATASLTAAITPDGRLLVEVADCGKGFDVAGARSRHDSLGLSGLAERVRLAGGHLDIVSHTGRGTRVCAEFPVSNSLAA